MPTLLAWGAIAIALAAGYALEAAALRVSQGTDLATVASAMLLAAAGGALASRIRIPRSPREAGLAAGAAPVPLPSVRVESLARFGHELRTPLHAIMTHVDALAFEATTDAQRAALATIRRNTDHVLALLVRALGETTATAPVQVSCRPAELVGDALSTLRHAAAAKGLALSLECPAPIPLAVLTDATAVRQVLVNLLENAIKFTERGTVRLVVDVVDMPHTALRFAVHDTGPGIAPEELATIFEPTVRGAHAAVPGSGLGLAIARELVRGLGGDVTVASLPGAGSTFTAIVPVALDAATEHGTIVLPPAAGAPPDPRPSLHGRILLVEDGDDVRALLAGALERAGAHVEAVRSGSEGLGRALAAAHVRHGFDVIFLDMQLPGLDGHEVVQRLRHAGCRTPVVALTAAAGAGDRARCLAEGCTEFLAKPVGLADLIATAERYLAHEPRPADAEPLTSTLPRGPELEAVVEAFVGLLDARVSEIEDAAGAGDGAAVGRLAHRLRGAAGSYGFAPISDAALALEEAAVQGGNLTPALVLLTRLCRRAAAAHGPRARRDASLEERSEAPVALGFEAVLRHES